jgi:hypothetical protein
VSRSARSDQTGRLLTMAAIAALAVITLLLAIFALRSSEVPGSGSLPPDPVPTWGDQPTASGAASTPTATPAASPTDRFIDVADAANAVRAVSSGCTDGVLPVLESTNDGGASWAPLTFGPQDVRQVLNVSMSSPSQIEAVVRTGDDCALSVIRTTTAGQSWETAGEDTSPPTFADRRAGNLIVANGPTAPPGCPSPIQVVPIASGLAAACSDGVYLYSSEQFSWSLISAVPVAAIAAAPDALSVYAAIRGVPGCVGAGIRSYEAASQPQDGVDSGCAAGAGPSDGLALSARSGELWLWSTSGIQKSTDGGANWSVAT